MARVGPGVIGIVAMLALAGCQQPQRKLLTHPPGTLRVRYEAASAPSSCLVACSVMAANYLLDQPRFTEPKLRKSLQLQKLDETSVGDLKQYLAAEGLELVTLTGWLDGNPPAGLKFWVVGKGYPAICVLNQHDGDVQFNHAVVVTGFSANTDGTEADIVYYLDPAAREPLQSAKLADFEANWARCDRAMLIVVRPPPVEQPAPRP